MKRVSASLRAFILASNLALLAALLPFRLGSAPPASNRGKAPPEKKRPVYKNMVLVPAGPFMMGCNRKVDSHCDPDELPYHRVELDAFYIDKFEVTNREYEKCVAAGACREPRIYPGFDGPDQPVVGVSWEDARDYCRWAGKRLPTEAEWEKAARGTDGRVYPWGNRHCGCACAVQEERQVYGCGRETTLPVGSAAKGVSPYRAMDMAGNVWEWTADWYDENYYRHSPDKNPKGPKNGDRKVRRGGCWANVRNYLRTSDRNPARPDSVSNSTGFRCAVSAPSMNKRPDN